jgi:uncharacterized repeat protein (TIGR03803 family)
VRCIDGSFPENVLLEGSDGNLYGTTSAGGGSGCGGVAGCGTIFRVTPEGEFATLLSFDGGANGISPQNGLAQATNGNFYGLTVTGGDSTCGVLNSSCGTTYSLDLGLAPFVSLLRNSARAGDSVEIVGEGLTESNRISFNGRSASFTVVSDSLIKAVVPAGARTGFVTVSTPLRKLKSRIPFKVIG